VDPIVGVEIMEKKTLAPAGKRTPAVQLNREAEEEKLIKYKCKI
jgi:hypothetical protein